MATKKFSKMATAKLQALLSTASDEDKEAIEQVLAARGILEQPQVNASEEEQPTEGEQPVDNGTDTLEAKTEEARENLYHRCSVLPFNCPNWVEGYIAGVIPDKRSKKVLYSIKTDDGRKVVKVCGSELLKIHDEVIEPTVTPRKHRTVEKKEKEDWTPEQIAEEMEPVIENVGRVVTLTKGTTINDDGEEVPASIEGRIVSLVPDRRAQRLLYRIHVPAPTEVDPKAVRIIHKVLHSAELSIAEDYDEVGEKMNEQFRGRQARIAQHVALTPQEKLLACQDKLNKAKERAEAAAKAVEVAEQKLTEAQAAYDAFLENGGEQPVENNNNDDDLA